MKYLFYTTSQSAWQGLLASMRTAKTSIYIEMYIFVDDMKEGNEFIAILSEKAKSGVAVRMVLDGFGSYSLSKEAIATLRNSGVEVLFFTKWFRRLHRKIVIVDERVGFLGGVNIHKSAKHWNDLLIRLEGKIVHSLTRSFRKVYKACGGTDPYLKNFKKKVLLGQTRLWFMEHLPSIRKPHLTDAYKEAIIEAQHKLIFLSPYFLPHRWMKRLLKEAVERGVYVEVIVPKHTDIGFITRANRRYMTLLHEVGVKFRLTNVMNHAKVMLIDDKLALVGSQNIDAMSFDFNAEAGLFFKDKKMIEDLISIIAIWKNNSEAFVPQKHITLFDRAVSILVRFLQPFL